MTHVLPSQHLKAGSGKESLQLSLGNLHVSRSWMGATVAAAVAAARTMVARNFMVKVLIVSDGIE